MPKKKKIRLCRCGGKPLTGFNLCWDCMSPAMGPVIIYLPVGRVED